MFRRSRVSRSRTTIYRGLNWENIIGVITIALVIWGNVLAYNAAP